jgi:hypothetical protein
MEQIQILQLKQLIGEIEVGMGKLDKKFDDFNNIKEEYAIVKNKFYNVKSILNDSIKTKPKNDLSGGKSL